MGTRADIVVGRHFRESCQMQVVCGLCRRQIVAVTACSLNERVRRSSVQQPAPCQAGAAVDQCPELVMAEVIGGQFDATRKGHTFNVALNLSHQAKGRELIEGIYNHFLITTAGFSQRVEIE